MPIPDSERVGRDVCLGNPLQLQTHKENAMSSAADIPENMPTSPAQAPETVHLDPAKPAPGTAEKRDHIEHALEEVDRKARENE